MYVLCNFLANVCLAAQALRLIISALGMLVGFSWERCFDAALGGLSVHVQGEGKGQDHVNDDNDEGPALFQRFIEKNVRQWP